MSGRDAGGCSVFSACNGSTRPARRSSPAPRAGRLLFLLLFLRGSLVLPGILAGQEHPGHMDFPSPFSPVAVASGHESIPVQESHSSRRIKHVLLGSAIGGAVGFGAYELAFRTMDICDSDDPGCETNVTRLQSILIGAGVGALIGLALGGGESPEEPAPLMLAPTSEGRWNLGISLRAPPILRGWPPLP